MHVCVHMCVHVCVHACMYVIEGEPKVSSFCKSGYVPEGEPEESSSVAMFQPAEDKTALWNQNQENLSQRKCELGDSAS